MATTKVPSLVRSNNRTLSQVIPDVYINDWLQAEEAFRDVFGKQLPEMQASVIATAIRAAALATLDQELRAIAQTSDNLRWYFCGNPLNKFLTGQRLTREEFYLLSAQGGMIIRSETDSEEAFVEFTHYLYEDDEQRGYIIPSQQPDSPPIPTGNGGWTQKVHVRMGIVPEKVRTSFLRPDQLNFFKDCKPELFSRFRKD